MKRPKPKPAAAPATSDNISCVKRRPIAANLRTKNLSWHGDYNLCVHDIIDHYDNGYTVKEIAQKFNLDIGLVQEYVRAIRKHEELSA